MKRYSDIRPYDLVVEGGCQACRIMHVLARDENDGSILAWEPLQPEVALTPRVAHIFIDLLTGGHHGNTRQA